MDLNSNVSTLATANNGSIFDTTDYNPNAPIAYWNQDLELAVVCTANASSLALIVTRVWWRRRQLHRFRADDIWIMVAGVLLVCPLWVSQIGANRYGDGLNIQNIPDSWLAMGFYFAIGWSGYYIVASMIKVSELAAFLEILPYPFVKSRMAVIAVGVISMSLGSAMTLIWIFQCQPISSNFNYDEDPNWCLNVVASRYAWVGLSAVIDIIITCIPLAIFRKMKLQLHERRILMMVFSANLIGTVVLLIGIYGIYISTDYASNSNPSFYDSAFIMLTDVEILAYAVGASAPMFSRFLISRAAARDRGDASMLKSPDLVWRKSLSGPFSIEYEPDEKAEQAAEVKAFEQKEYDPQSPSIGNFF